MSKLHSTPLHEVLHCAAASIALAGIHNVSGEILAYIELDDRNPHTGAGMCRLQLPENLQMHADRVRALSACGPLAFFGSAQSIGGAILEERQREEMSSIDCELAANVSSIDQFIIGAATSAWLTLVHRRIGDFHKALTAWDVMFHSPLPIPLSTFCPGSLAGKLRFQARQLVPRYLPAKATFKRIARAA